MKKTKVLAIKLQSLVFISAKALKATDYNGNTDTLPISQVFWNNITEDGVYWVAEWILKQKKLVYSDKKEGWYNPKTGIIEVSSNSGVKVSFKKGGTKIKSFGDTIIERFIPDKIDPINIEPDNDLLK